MASGDAFTVINEAGNGSTWSYTTTADLVITCYANNSAADVRIGTWVSGTSGVRYLLREGNDTMTAQTQFNKLVLKSGTTITMDNVDVNVYGTFIGGFEL